MKLTRRNKMKIHTNRYSATAAQKQLSCDVVNTSESASSSGFSTCKAGKKKGPTVEGTDAQHISAAERVQLRARARKDDNLNELSTVAKSGTLNRRATRMDWSIARQRS